MLYQNELSVEYFGDLVSAAAAVSLNQSKVPSQVDRAAPGKGSGGLFQNIRPQGASPGTSNASRSSNLLRASQPGLRLLMALFRLQEEEDREEEEGGDEETEEEEGEESWEEDEREGVRKRERNADERGSVERRKRSRSRKDAMFADIQNHRSLLEMLGESRDRQQKVIVKCIN